MLIISATKESSMTKTLRQYIEQLEQIAAEYGNDIPVVCRDSYDLPFTF